MGDYGFEGAGEFGGQDYPADDELYANKIFSNMKHYTRLHEALDDAIGKRPQQTEYQTSFTVFPDHTNYNNPPSIFGGKMLAEMDNCAAMTVRRALYGTDCTDAITVGVTNLAFHRPAFVGEIVHLSGKVIAVGKKSVTCIVECTRENKKGEIHTMAKGQFTFCARKSGVPAEHGLKL